MPGEGIKDVDEEAHAPASTEEIMDQEKIEKKLTEGDDSQPKLRR